MSRKALIREVKAGGQDHEFYPTTNQIIDAMIADISTYCAPPAMDWNERMRREKLFKQDGNDRAERGVLTEDFRSLRSVLDVGAGDGKVLTAISEAWGGSLTLFAIEKAEPLLAVLASRCFIVGTDLSEQSLITRQVDLVFSNPPYSEYAGWACKIIEEAAARVIYLVLPRRWKDNEAIQYSIRYRDAYAAVVGEFDFENAEDRQARAIVHLVRIALPPSSDDAFQRFFDREFADLKEKFGTEGAAEKELTNAQKEEQRARKFTQIVGARDYPRALVELYDKEMDHIRQNYYAVAGLDTDLLRELNIYPSVICANLKQRLADLKQTYWQHLFTHMEPITGRLVSRRRDALLGTLRENGHVDFTLSNIYAVLVWVLGQANQETQNQVLDLFDDLLSRANCRNYKSNQKVYGANSWRYKEDRPTHVSLEYRIVLEGWRGMDCSWREPRLHESGASLLRDILTVATTLGFDCNTVDYRLGYAARWKPGQTEVFFGAYDGKAIDLLEVKAFKNGNLHIRMHQKLALAINVTVGRLRGWLHGPGSAAVELCDPEAATAWNALPALDMAALPKRLLAQTEEVA